MSRRKKDPLRSLTEEEREILDQIARSIVNRPVMSHERKPFWRLPMAKII